MHLLLTRPEEDSRRSAEKLIAAGHRVTIAPMTRIVFRPGPDIAPDGCQALVFSSANAVRAFAARSAVRDIRVFTVGDRSAGIARDLGFAEVRSAAGDSGDLTALLARCLSPAGDPVLYLTGRHIAADIGNSPALGKFTIKREVVYEAEAVTTVSPACRKALMGGEIDAALFYSRRGAELFSALVGDYRITGALGAMTACCLAPRVAEGLKAADWAAIEIAPHPDEDHLLALPGLAR